MLGRWRLAGGADGRIIGAEGRTMGATEGGAGREYDGIDGGL